MVGLQTDIFPSNGRSRFLCDSTITFRHVKWQEQEIINSHIEEQVHSSGNASDLYSRWGGAFRISAGASTILAEIFRGLPQPPDKCRAINSNQATTASLGPPYTYSFAFSSNWDSSTCRSSPPHRQIELSVRPVIWLSVDVCTFFVGKMSSVDEFLAFAAIAWFLKKKERNTADCGGKSGLTGIITPI
jgi:hypothetical protein